MKAGLIQLSQYTWSRTRERLEGLTDDEYLWEPVPGGRSIRPAADGTYRPDWVSPADPPPLTNIAWRLFHLITCYGARRNREWLGVPVEGPTDRFEANAPAPPTAAAAIETLEAAYAEWNAVLSMLPEATLAESLGPIAGPYSDADKAGFVLHMLDEFIHHAAEVALLRDLWRARGSVDASG